ncbi:hypothetical protein [Hymenobacter lucidus]|uniref:Uncharacterized protein n=1 Tax=Hymenobacter lucidus TaxID=2880930 RepID=A0ABS8AXA8_9BACT|nr:hypothetical protein [Hymenobacter lucidus]MCB2410417.1 hypothetical protein [Hymenobacter lucidus]
MPAIPTSSSRPYVSRRKRSHSSESSGLSAKATAGLLSLLIFALLASLAVIAAHLPDEEPGRAPNTISAAVTAPATNQ